MDISEDSTGLPLCAVNPECQEPVDVILLTSDGDHLGAHKRSLDIFSGGFTEGIDADVEIPMTESTKVLRVMLQFMHPYHHYPDIKSLDFDTVLHPLAEAVEEYLVYGGMALCQIYMEEAIPSHPMEVLAYALRNEYFDMVNKAAPYTIGHSTGEVICKYPYRMDVLVTWLLYREQWQEIIHFIHKMPLITTTFHLNDHRHTCKAWPDFHRQLLIYVGTTPSEVLLAPRKIMMENALVSLVENCAACMSRADDCVVEIDDRVQEMIKPFTSFISEENLNEV